jgi:hypothetical protein
VQVPGASACWLVGCGVVVIGGSNLTAPLNSQVPSKLAECCLFAAASPAGSSTSTAVTTIATRLT